MVYMVITMFMAGLLVAGAAAAQSPPTTGDGLLVLGRYTTQTADPPPGAGEPLDVVAQISFPRAQVRTIGEAVRHTLLRTGYTLADDAQLTPEADQFLALSLPESQREVGSYRVQAILDVLLGPTWEWHSDPVRRRLWFTVAPRYAALVQPIPPAAHLASVDADTAAKAMPVATTDARPEPLPSQATIERGGP